MIPSWYAPPPLRCVSGRQILERVARLHDVSIEDITGPSRLRHICMARWDAMRQMRDRKLTTTRIGELLNRDHTTVMHGLRRAG